MLTSSGTSVSRTSLERLSSPSFKERAIRLCGVGQRVSALFAFPVGSPGHSREILGVFTDDEAHQLRLISTMLEAGAEYPAVARELPEAQAFERELAESGIVVKDHPWLKPLREHGDRKYPFFPIVGDGLHEVAVGPVHAGIIEPGHFRFQCYGEKVLHLEIQLGYQHRGAEALLLRSQPSRRLAVAESIAGDTVIGHGWAYCRTIEALSRVEVSPRAEAIRTIALELERLANHVGDLGALCNDVGFLPGASYLGRLRGEFLNLLLTISGNRFGRGLICPGGVAFDIDDPMRTEILGRLKILDRDVTHVLQMLFQKNALVSRFERTGVVPYDMAEDLGLVGPAARASGCDRDVRRDHPYGAFRSSPCPVALRKGGDVMARAVVRRLEVQHSLHLLFGLLSTLPNGEFLEPCPAFGTDRVVATLIEGWRGEIAHVAVTDSRGGLAAYKIIDPSFHNWFALAMAMRNGQVSDFPLCNKSFNLSYAGHDL